MYVGGEEERIDQGVGGEGLEWKGKYKSERGGWEWEVGVGV